MGRGSEQGNPENTDPGRCLFSHGRQEQASTQDPASPQTCSQARATLMDSKIKKPICSWEFL